MKMVRYGLPTAETPGVVDKNGILRDATELAGKWRDWRVESLEDDSLAKIRDYDFTTLPPAPADSRLGPPVAGVRKILGIGLNYRAHAAESGMAPPEDPIIFHKPVTSLCGPNDDIVLPRGGIRRTGRLSWRLSSGSAASTSRKGTRLIMSRDTASATMFRSGRFSWSAVRSGRKGKGRTHSRRWGRGW